MLDYLLIYSSEFSPRCSPLAHKTSAIFLYTFLATSFRILNIVIWLVVCISACTSMYRLSSENDLLGKLFSPRKWWTLKRYSCSKASLLHEIRTLTTSRQVWMHAQCIMGQEILTREERQDVIVHEKIKIKIKSSVAGGISQLQDPLVYDVSIFVLRVHLNFPNRDCDCPA